MKIREVYTKVFIGLCLTAVISSCSSSDKKHCQEIDWYEIGRADGLKGISNNQRRAVQPICEATDPSLTEALYHNGFDKGVAHFCGFDTGFSLGRASKPISPICPPLLQDEFDKGYRQGERFSQLERLRSEVSFRLEALNEKLEEDDIDLPAKGLIKSQKIELEKKKEEINQELSAIQKSTSVR